MKSENKKKYTILIVDDEVAIQETLKSHFKYKGFDIYKGT